MMALRHSAFYAPYLMTISGGYLEKQGLQPMYVPQTPDNLVVDAFAAGRCHVSQSAVATSFAQLENGAVVDVVHFAQINERDGFFMTARQPDEAFTWNKLRGADILVDHFFQPLAMLKYALYQQGLMYDDINAIDAGDVAAIDMAFRQGQAAYVHQQGPAPQQLEHEGKAYVVAAVGDAVGPVAFSSLCAHRDWLQTDMACCFMAAYLEAREFVIQAPAMDVAKLIAHHLPEIDLQVLCTTIAAYQNLGCWTPHAHITEAAYETLLDVFQYSGGIKSRHAYAAAIVPPPVT